LPQRWFEIALEVPASLVDEAAALLDFAGFGGVEVRDRTDPAQVVVVVECENDHDAGERAAIARDAVAVLGGAPAARIVELDPKVWTENWKKHFARRTFAGRVEVRPPWEQPSAEENGLVSIVINPGMAFGTGLHETTAGCLELLAEELRPGDRVADVGCGSGILAIAAARLGASFVLATDVDPLATEAAAENVAANSVNTLVRVEMEEGELGIPEWETNARPGLSTARSDADKTSATPLSGSRAKAGGSGTGIRAAAAGSFDLVVANILAETLVELRDVLTGAVRAGGTLILSGIEARRLKIVEEAFIRSPWCIARVLARGEWVSLSVHHQALAEPVRAPSVTVRGRAPGAP
jgi:ribosomal protein L11 methyltransferase